MEQDKINSSEEQEIGTLDKAKRSVKRFFKKLLIWGSLILIVGLAGYLSFARIATFSSGSRSGKVIKFSKKGVLFKTYEGQINVGDFAQGIWDFSVYPGDDDIQREIENALEQGYEVKVKYKERYVNIFFWGDTKYFVYDVDRVIE